MLSEIKLIRIDERLIHSQIMFTWLKRANINTIIIVDDEIANDSFMSHIYKLTTPPSIDIKVFTKDDMIEYYNERCKVPYSKVRTLVIMKKLEEAVYLYKRKIDFEKILVSDSYLELFRKDSLSDSFISSLKYFKTNKVLVYHQKTVGSSITKLNM